MKESRIVLPAVKQGTRPSVNDQIKVEKFADRLNSSQNRNLSRPQSGILPTSGHSGSPTIHSRETKINGLEKSIRKLSIVFTVL